MSSSTLATYFSCACSGVRASSLSLLQALYFALPCVYADISASLRFYLARKGEANLEVKHARLGGGVERLAEGDLVEGCWG